MRAVAVVPGTREVRLVEQEAPRVTAPTHVKFLAAFQLGRLVTRDDEQCEVEAAGAPRVRRTMRRGRAFEGMR